MDVLCEVNLVNLVVYLEDGVDCFDYFYVCGVWVDCEWFDLVVVLLDIKMLCMNGLDVFMQMCLDECMCCILVVILLFLCEESDLVCSWDLGVNVYVIKLVDVDQFFEVVCILGQFWVVFNQVFEVE